MPVANRLHLRTSGSNENHDIHEASTIAFMVFSVLHQWMQIVMFIWSRPGPMTNVCDGGGVGGGGAASP